MISLSFYTCLPTHMIHIIFKYRTVKLESVPDISVVTEVSNRVSCMNPGLSIHAWIFNCWVSPRHVHLTSSSLILVTTDHILAPHHAHCSDEIGQPHQVNIYLFKYCGMSQYVSSLIWSCWEVFFLIPGVQVLPLNLDVNMRKSTKQRDQWSTVATKAAHIVLKKEAVIY